MPVTQTSQVIVVEDDFSMSLAIERILRLAGFDPLTFDSAEAFLEEDQPLQAACLIFDVHLPGITGFELHSRLCGRAPQPPVIFISAYDETEGRAQAAEAGALAYLPKPFSGHDLIAAVVRATTH